ncbi:hypothetical protein OBV_17710 [Oscillibacter valericigenes Sjm18-20]|nr:hypothetical protein OBV_17710 [Oscillibacter valericigenes Sjm18-20]
MRGIRDTKQMKSAIPIWYLRIHETQHRKMRVVGSRILFQVMGCFLLLSDENMNFQAFKIRQL